MNLFDIIPQNYFGLFGGKNRSIYIDSLLILFNLLESDETIISKSDFLKALKEKENNLDSFEYEKEDLENLPDDVILQNTLSSKASFICKRLEETGWIDVIMDPNTFEETIILPQYSILLLKCFKDIISDEESPYLSLVHSTYSELKLEDEEQDELMYATIIRSYENTKKLKVELITLTHSIRIFQSKWTKLFDTNTILHNYFDVYKMKISDRYYHPLKTFDSVARFKRPIIKILEKWLADKDIRQKLVIQASRGTSQISVQEIEKDIIEKINYITDTYEKLNNLISEIDKENNNYTKSSANKILFLNNNDKTVKGYLENIMKIYAKNTNEPRVLSKILSKMQDSTYFYDQGYIDSNSITLPILRKIRENSEPMELITFEEANDYLLDSFLEETKSIFTDEKVYGFMEQAFGDRDRIGIKDIPLINFDAFICLILAVIKKDDDSCFYYVNEVDDRRIHTYGYVVPNFEFIKKD